MKKLFFFAAAALTLAACTSEELNVQDQQKLVEDNAAVNFDVYAQRGVTRAGVPGDITNDNIKGTDHKEGFGVFAFYTNDTQYSSSATPNFMYNQQVKWDGSKWTYEPVKYWPNEYGDAAISDEIDYVTFFAYAPWTEVEPTTGKPKATNANEENYNIVGVTKNNATGDPIVKYVVDTDPATSVDLLWGVKAENGSTETSINGEVESPEPGMPFIDLTKPADPVNGKIKFNLKHALAKVKVTIDYIDDAETPEGPAAKKLNADETRIYVRWLEISGFTMKGALNLNNDEAGVPNWKDFEGLKELEFPETTRFNDGRKDAKEGTQNGQANNELNICLNDSIIENFASTEKKEGKIVFGAKKSCGVLAAPQLVFGGDSTKNGGYFYVIPRNQEGELVDVKINYDVLTLDSCLANTLSGTKDFGSEIENQIEKLDIFKGADFEPGKVYTIKIHLGMTSVKIDAEVTGWDDADNGQPNVDLPDNQPEGDDSGSADGISAAALNNVSLNNGGVINAVAATDTDPLTVNYTVPTSGGKEAIEGDFARIFAALNAQGVTEITLNNKTYTWSDTYNAFVNGAQNTKIEAMLAGSFANAPSYSVTMTTNKGEIKFVKA